MANWDPTGLKQKLGFITIKGGPDEWRWFLQWHLAEPSPKGGWIIQETTVDGGKVHFWEAWHVSAGQQDTDEVCNEESNHDDENQDIIYTGRGVNFSASFYEGLTLPSIFKPHNPDSPESGAAPSTPINPNLLPTSGTDPVKRRWNNPPYSPPKN